MIRLISFCIHHTEAAKKAQEQQTFIVLLFPRLYSLHCHQCGTSI